MADALERYLRDVSFIHRSGGAVKETSYYPALSNLFNEVGSHLKPKVRCIINIANRGGGIPDGGFFTRDQFPRASSGDPIAGAIPSRGAIEVKAPSEDVRKIARSLQVRKYLDRYAQVLVTNLRAFVLVGSDRSGAPVFLESYEVAPSETAFWEVAADPLLAAAEHGDRFDGFIRRVMLHAAPLAAPEDLAWFLASYARDANARIANVKLGALDVLRGALEEALGLKFEGEKGDHFFRSTLVQTLFYGVFSAWVLWCKRHAPDSGERFRWHETPWYLHVPMIGPLYEQIALPGKLKPLGIGEVLDWTETVLNRVDRAAFFTRFEEHHAVQYFYEPFLARFDPELRKSLGVWFTPPEIVEYMITRVDHALRTELDIEDGLADERVIILDPCTGTGSYLVEALRHMSVTLSAKYGPDLAGQYVKKAAQERVFGFEILPAPCVVAHLQVGLLLQNLGAPLRAEDGERAGVFLTNALTGWVASDDNAEKTSQIVLGGFDELLTERDHAAEVKREKRILVIVGNPPYNAFAGVSPAEEQGLVEPYKAGLVKDWGIKKFNLDDLYVRFFRMAERRIAEYTGEGIICFISNFSYLDDPSFVVMRKRFLAEFDKIWIDCLNGDSRETGKETPDGAPDPSVFSTEFNRAGIRTGTTIGLMVRKKSHESCTSVRFRHLWGATKREDLLASAVDPKLESAYESVLPTKDGYHSFKPLRVSQSYFSWPGIDELVGKVLSLGALENRGETLIAIDRDRLAQTMKSYFDPAISWAQLKAAKHGLTTDFARFDAAKTRRNALATQRFEEPSIRRVLARPMDVRWCYYTTFRPIWNESRADYVQQCSAENPSLVTRRRGVASPEGVPFFFASVAGMQHALTTDAYYAPFKQIAAPARRQAATQVSLMADEFQPVPNLSEKASAYLESVGSPGESASLPLHVLAIGYSREYLAENDGGIRQAWPRIPLPATAAALKASAELGKDVATLLDSEVPVKGVTAGSLRDELAPVGLITRIGRTPDFAVTAGWGYSGQGGITMPGHGKLERRAYTSEELAAMTSGVTKLGLSADQVSKRLGAATLDVYLNDTTYWCNVPEAVWAYTIGGYQVMKKWLSYREEPLLGRPLAPDEAREVMNIARRIAALLLLEPALDANYRAVTSSIFSWSGRPD